MTDSSRIVSKLVSRIQSKGNSEGNSFNLSEEDDEYLKLFDDRHEFYDRHNDSPDNVTMIEFKTLKIQYSAAELVKTSIDEV